MNYEPLIHTEQGVVYLFSKYWELIPPFKEIIKSIVDTHTLFPDFEYMDHSDVLCGLEFEYRLSGFKSHLKSISKIMREEEIKNILVVYWEEDMNTELIKNIVKKKGINIHFIQLKDFFSPTTIKSDDGLNAFWALTKKFKESELYPYSSIKDKLSKLEKEGIIEICKVDKDTWRTMGWDVAQAGFKEINHWRNIHILPTTTQFDMDRLPSRLFIKPKGLKCVVGYLDIKQAFKIINPKKIHNFLREFYFHTDLDKNYICFIYESYNSLDGINGRELFTLLEHLFRNQGSKIIEPKLHKKIQKIINL